MKDKGWNSTPSFFGEYKRISVGACFLLGTILLFVSFYVLATEISFYHKATMFDATIVEIRHEYVAAGRGSVLAYLPVVEIPDRGSRISVETSSEENVYTVGARIRVLCDLSSSQRCIKSTFFDQWWGIVDLIVALLFLVPSVLYLRRTNKGSEDVPTLDATE